MGFLGLHTCMKFLKKKSLYIYIVMHHLTMEILSKKYENFILVVENILVPALLGDLVRFSWMVSPPRLLFLSSLLRLWNKWMRFHEWVSVRCYCSPGKDLWLLPVAEGLTLSLKWWSLRCDLLFLVTWASFRRWGATLVPLCTVPGLFTASVPSYSYNRGFSALTSSKILVNI